MKKTIVTEGKTKILERTDIDDLLLVTTKDSLTGGDGAKKEVVDGIAKHKTTQTCNVFRFLEANGIPTSFVMQNDETSFLCSECEMLPLELVTRRFAWGSILKRWPIFVRDLEDTPYRFGTIKSEIFHKHSVVMPPLVDAPVQIDEGEARAQYLKKRGWDKNVYTDPLVVVGDVKGGNWVLHSAKDPFLPSSRLMEIPPVVSEEDLTFLITEIMVPVFKLLEEAWAKIETKDGPVALVDMKIEVGRRKNDGKLVVADVIDNDNWRIWPGGDPTKQLDKQCFREGHPLNEVSEKYALVSKLTKKFTEQT